MNKQIAALAIDEENIVMWDIDAVIFDYCNHPYITVDTNKLTPNEWLTIDREYAATTNTNKPMILFELPNNQLYIADGNHRLFKAVSENIQKMNVIVVPEEKHLTYLYKSDVDCYHRVVNGLRNEGVFINNFMHN